MNISLNWLNDYLKTDLSAVEIADILTSIGLEVSGIEKFESLKGGLKGLVVGEVKTCIPHPDSDHLSVTTVDIAGERLLNIVCGAPNVAAGQKVVVATVGTVLYKGNEEFVIKKSKIRGQESEGMICSEAEIGVSDDHEGITVLPNDIANGTPASEYYKVVTDNVIGIDITPNRISGASHVGVARELAAYLQQRGSSLHYSLPSVDSFKPSVSNDIIIEIARPEACKRYAGVCINNITVKPSPQWLQNRLKAIGLNPINNIVDVTNFILFELGQPLHAFDKNQIAGGKVITRSYPTGTKFITLDGVERSLDENDLMVCDAEKPMCIAGVFGGLNSGISDDTTSVFIESAYFDSVFVRKTARRHGLSTDASFHFERGSDPNIVIYAAKRAALLIQEVAGGEISEITDIYPSPVTDTEISVAYDYINRLVGKTIEHETIKDILRSLEIKIKEESEDSLVVSVSPMHVDVKQPADIVEEVLRIYGFNNVEEPSRLSSSLSYSHKPDDYRLRDMISNLLASKGFNEMMNNSLVKASRYNGLTSFPAENTVMLFNPLSSDLNGMRQTLLFGGLDVIAYNNNRRNHNLKLFEFGKSYIYRKQEGGDPLKQYSESNKLALFITGNKTELSWNKKEEKSDFFTVKTYAELLLKRLGMQPEQMNVETVNNDIFSEGLVYKFNGKNILHLGKVSRSLLKKSDVEQDVYYAELDWEYLVKTLKNVSTVFTPIPKYPAVKRDLALLLDKSVTFGEVRDIALRTEKKLLKEVHLFDIYEGDKLGADKKSYAVSFILQDDEQTLTDKQIDKIMNKLIGTYKYQLKAEIR